MAYTRTATTRQNHTLQLFSTSPLYTAPLRNRSSSELESRSFSFLAFNHNQRSGGRVAHPCPSIRRHGWLDGPCLETASGVFWLLGVVRLPKARPARSGDSNSRAGNTTWRPSAKSNTNCTDRRPVSRCPESQVVGSARAQQRTLSLAERRYTHARQRSHGPTTTHTQQGQGWVGE